jgi:hypothetical protein
MIGCEVGQKQPTAEGGYSRLLLLEFHHAFREANHNVNKAMR